MTEQRFPELEFRRDGAVGVVTLCNPARLNPITATMQTSLRALLAQVAADNTLRALVLTGSGRAFCSGADLNGLIPEDGTGRSKGQQTADAMHAMTNRLVLDLRALPLPLVCAINGAAAGGGLGLALAGDVVLAARSA
jgi:2-(1,2-epoxy-1,2-dihydrophenyl)acetyl-CoA isomerase